MTTVNPVSLKPRVVFSCPSCDAPLRALASQVGQSFSCPSCQKLIVAPKTARASAEGEDWWAVDLPEDGGEFFPEGLPPAAEQKPPVAPSRPAASNPRPASPQRPAAPNQAPNGANKKPAAPAKRPTPTSAAPSSAAAQPKPSGSKSSADSEASKPSSPYPQPVPQADLDPDDLFGSLQPLEPTPKKVDSTDPNAWLQQHGYSPLDDLPAFPSEAEMPSQPARPVAPPASGPAPVQQYRARCHVCEATVTVRATQAGKQMRCPDCHSHFTVPPPPAPKPVSTAPKAIAPPTDSLPSPEPNRFERTDAYGRNAQDYMRAAEAAPPDNAEENYENPDVHGWLSHVFGMFLDPGVLVHLFGLTFVALIMSAAASIGGPYVQLAAIIRILATGLITVISLGCGIVILEGTSNGSRRIDNWPATDPMEWLGHLFVVCAAAFVAGLPGFLLGYPTGNSFAQLAMTLISIHIIFPVVIMSMLDNNSPFQPISQEVLRSAPRIPESWIGFYITSGILLLVFFITFWASGFLPTMIGYFVCYVGLIFTIFLYMRMLGHLGYEIGFAVNNAEEDAIEEKET